jgi:hypothetical protein
LSDADFCTLREFLAGVRHRWQSRRKQPQRCSGGKPEPIIFDMIGPRSWGCDASMSLTRFSGEGPSRLRSHFGANVKLW